MGWVRDRLRRSMEAAHLVLRHANDRASRRALLACYREMFRTTCSQEQLELTLKVRGRRFPVAMRKSDIFTLAEILHEKQYRLRTPLRTEPVFVDAGANVGFACIWFLARYPGATVYCFEPEATNFALLEGNVGAIDGVHVVRAALGAEDGHVHLRLSDHGAMHSIVDEEATAGTERVPLVRLDTYLEQNGVDRVDVVKIDVEGADLDLLRGLGRRIDDVHVITGEMHETMVSVEAFYGHLDQHGFDVLRRTRFAGAREAGVHHFEAVRS